MARTVITYEQETGTVILGPAAGAVECLPSHRSWQLTFLGLTPGARILATLDGSVVEPDVTEVMGQVAVAITDVLVTSTVSVIVGGHPVLAENDVKGRIFTLLDRAQIEFELKKKIYDIACSGRPLAVQLSALQALALPRSLETAVGEILTANSGPGS